MLERLSGQTHQVYTAFCLAWSAGGPRTGRGLHTVWLEVVRTQVHFRRLSAEQISAYVAEGAPFDKAGAYGIQDRAHRLVEGIRGSYYNVVGLPLQQVKTALATLGWRGPFASSRPCVWGHGRKVRAGGCRAVCRLAAPPTDFYHS